MAQRRVPASEPKWIARTGKFDAVREPRRTEFQVARVIGVSQMHAAGRNRVLDILPRKQTGHVEPRMIVKRAIFIVGIGRDGKIVFYRRGAPSTGDILKATAAAKL